MIEIEDDPTGPITEFKRQYRFLSNFWPCEVFLAPHMYPSVEHAYQAAKTLNMDERTKVRTAASAGLAKRFGRTVTMRKDWERLKLTIMADLVFQKFILDPEMRARLVATGDRELIEGNSHGDDFFGKCSAVGQNHLGRLLMEVRAIAKHIADNQPKAKDVPDELHDDGAGEP